MYFDVVITISIFLLILEIYLLLDIEHSAFVLGHDSLNSMK